MKFVCDKCKTKYSIADEKVRRKVLKIRCKNCANVIIVREAVDSKVAAAGGGALSQAFEGAFSEKKKPARKKTAVPPPPAIGSTLPKSEAMLEIPGNALFGDEQTVLSEVPDMAIAEESQVDWYLAVDDHQYGPMSFAELCSRVKRGEARSETGEEAHVWHDGFDDWHEVTKVPELRHYAPPPPPKARSGVWRVSAMGVAPAHPGAADSQVQPGPYAMQPNLDTTLPSLPPTPGQMGAGQPPMMGPGQPAAGTGQLPQIPPLQRPGAGTGQQPMMPMDHNSQMIALAAMEQQIAAAAAQGVGVAPGTMSLPIQQGVRTPVWLKVAAIGGIGCMLLGAATMVYFIFFYGPPEPREPRDRVVSLPTGQIATTPPAKTVVVNTQPAVAVDAGEEPSAPSISVSMTERAVKTASAVARTRKNSGATKGKAATGQKKLSDKERRLLAMYGPGVGEKGIPATKKKVARKRVKRLTEYQVKKVVTRNARSLKACYDKALKRDDSITELRGEVTVYIGETGVVRKSTVKAGNNHFLISCLQRSIKRWSFPSQGAQAIQFPLFFRSSSN
jgi:predicted Zn finger-like uncharacterized protein